MGRCRVFLILLLAVVQVLTHPDSADGQVIHELSEQFQLFSKDTAIVSNLINASLKQHNNPDSAIVLLERLLYLARVLVIQMAVRGRC